LPTWPAGFPSPAADYVESVRREVA
jgi:hypothetical protein